MLRLLHTADLHLDARFPELGGRESQRRLDQHKTFERLVALAIKHEVQFFVVAGDLFDTPRPPAAAVELVRTGLKRLDSRGIRTLLLPGCHDSALAAGSVYRRETFPGATVLGVEPQPDPVRLEAGGQPLYVYAAGTSAGDRDLAGLRRQNRPGLHLGLVHGSRVDGTSRGGAGRGACVDWERLPELGLDYVALGHQHAMATLTAAERCFACYPGSPEGLCFGENGPRYAVLVTLAADGARLEPCQVNSRRLEEHDLDLDGCGSSDTLQQMLAQLADPELLLRARLTGQVETLLDPAQTLRQCRNGFFHLELHDRTTLLGSSLCRRIAVEPTVRGRCVQQLAGMLASASEPRRRRILEAACREVLLRFGEGGGGAP